LAQPRVQHFDQFDSEGSYDDYGRVFDEFKEEGIKGRVRELRKISHRIELHVRLNRKGEIVEHREYTDSARLVRVKTFVNKRIIKETEFKLDNTRRYVFYEYNKSNKLISKTYANNKRNKRPTTTKKYVYNDKGQIVLREHGTLWREKFEYEGDSIEWKLIIDNDKLLKVSRRLKKQAYEQITIYKIDSLSKSDFKERIVPRMVLETRWDDKGNLIEESGYVYDSIGDKVLKSIKKYEYNGQLLINASHIINNNLVEEEYLDNYFYTDKGLLQSELHKHGSRTKKVEYEYDEQGNLILQHGFIFRYSYDGNGNWMQKQSFKKAKSTWAYIKNGVTTTEKFKDDTWITEETREISFF
jgi:hypothetical protein